MKRIHLFEFEDFKWFPHFLRTCMTNYIVAIHKLLGSRTDLVALLNKVLPHASQPHIVDLCSGGGGPMPAVLEELNSQREEKPIQLTLTDLYPNLEAAKRFNEDAGNGIEYHVQPVDATNVEQSLGGVRTMNCSLHHMRPEIAREILKNAKDLKEPICVFEISDNSLPTWLWWVAIPTTFLSVFFITPLVRPMTWQQIVFTYLIPLLPIFIAWDGAVSNVRTYTPEDLEVLLTDLKDPSYSWEIGKIKAKGTHKLYLLGWPA